MTHSLTLGSLLLTDAMPDDDHDFVLNVLADGAGFGAASSVQDIVTSLLPDGDLMRTRRYGNREVKFAVEITGPSLASLAQGEAALRREAGRANLLTWQPPDDFAAPTVFEVLTSEMSQTFDDLDEMRRRRKFTLTLTCAPYARSADPVTVVAIAPPPAGTPTTATLNNADTTAGWSAVLSTYVFSAGGWQDQPVALTDVGDGVNVSATGHRLEVTCNLGSAVSISATPYVVVEMAGWSPSAYFRFTTVNGVHDLPVAAAYTTAAGTIRYFFDVGSKSSAVSAVTFGWGQGNNISYQTRWQATFYDIGATDTLPFVNSHQTSRVLEGKGTERTPASIEVSPGASGTSIGWTVIHTAPAGLSGNSPALRQYRTQGNTRLANAAFMSGEAEPVNATPIVAQVPLASLPQGEYSLVALMRSSVAGTFPINWQARTLLPGVGYLGGTSGTASAKFDATDTWTLVPLDVVTLPPVRSNGAFVQLNLSRIPTGETIEVDEWWALRIGDDCATTILYGSAAYLWLDSPDVDSAVPRVWTGGNGDRSDAHHPGFNLYAQGSHVLHPDGTAIFVATSGLDHPNVSATFHPRWHSNAAE